MASSSRQSGLEVRSESTFFDPLLSSWMTREPVRRESYSIWEDDESRKKERDSETDYFEVILIFNDYVTWRVTKIGERPRSRARVVLRCLLGCLRVCADYLFGCEEDEQGHRRGKDQEDYASSPTVTTPSGCSIEDSEDTPLVRNSSDWLPTYREIKELFRIFDKNHDNTISSSELGKMLTCMGMEVSEEEVETLMKELDKNGNGKIEYREFKAFMQDEMRRSEENPEEQEKAIRMAFKVFDQNGDGVIDAAELKTAMKNLGEPLSDKELNDMMKQADIDKDGKINYEEFIRVWSKSMK